MDTDLTELFLYGHYTTGRNGFESILWTAFVTFPYRFD
jgi:hypothetical protein